MNGQRRCGNINTMEHYSTMKKHKIMPFAATWMYLEIIILNEVNQTEKDKQHLQYSTGDYIRYLGIIFSRK